MNNNYLKDLISNDALDLSFEDVLPDIRLLMSNIPDDLTPLQKVRFIYINLGKLFSYDYRIANHPELGYEKKVDYNKRIDRYQSCVQISEVLNIVLNKIEGVSSTVISRGLPDSRGYFGKYHVGNDVVVNDNGFKLRIFLDLTLDLFLIQSDCKTRYFGFQDDGKGTYDIISQSENRDMDKVIGFINKDEDYNDYNISRVKNAIKQMDFSKMIDEEIINYKLDLIMGLYKKFPGYYEGKQYTNMLFDELLGYEYKEFNLYFNENDKINFKTVYRIGNNDNWIFYSNNFGFVKTDISKLKDMLDSGWYTNSETLLDIVYSVDNQKSSR